MDHVEVQPHIALRQGQVEPVVLTVGDPGRVDSVLEHCESYEELAFNREYRSVNAVFNGQKFTVISHGIGVSGAMICFEELIKLGAKIIIRAGTCGSLKPDKIKTGELFVPYAVVREVDASDLYVPSRLPAVATPRIYQAIMKAGEDMKIPLLSGIGLSAGLFYHTGEDFLSVLRKWSRFTDIVEFEFQALFLVGLVRGIEFGGIATVDGSPLEWDKKNYDPTGAVCKQGKSNMLKLCVQTCALLRKEFPAKN